MKKTEAVKIPFHSWPRRWAEEYPRSRIWATNVSGSDERIADVRGEIGRVELPFTKGERLQIIVVPEPTPDGKIICEMPLVRESLTVDTALRLGTAVQQVSLAQRIDHADALCYISQLYLSLMDWRRACRGQELWIERQPQVPMDVSAWEEIHQNNFLAHVSMPLTALSMLLDFWSAVGGTLLMGFPHALVDPMERVTYVTIPAGVIPPDLVRTLYGAADESLCQMRRTGKRWLVTYRGKTADLRSSKGLTHIAHLLQRKGVPIDVQVLEGRTAGLSASKASLIEHGLESMSRWTRQEQRSDDSLDALDLMIQEIEENDLEIAVSVGDSDAEAAALTRIGELESARAISRSRGGRLSPVADEAERARVRVRNAIKDTLKKNQQAIPELKAHLDDSLEFGQTIMYSPVDDLEWTIRFH